MIVREPIFAALFALGKEATWDTPARGFLTKSRRVLTFDQCNDQPAFFQVEGDEDPQQVTGMPYKWTLDATWMVYQNMGRDPEAVPASENNLILDALTGTLGPQLLPGVEFTDRCTLGGLVYNVRIEGRITKYAGDLDGQGIVVVPLKILVP